jgi:hypothetical protein
MRTHLVLGALIVVAACGDSSSDDDGPPDQTPPALASITPQAGMPVWLHAPIRLTFDEPLDDASVAMTVTASLGGSAVPAQVTFEAPSTVAIALDPSVRGIGPLDVSITGSVKDLAGNAFAAPIALSFVAPAWSATSVDRGHASTAPELAVAADGTVYAAWLVGNAGARRAVVSALDGNTWESLGDELGRGDVASVALALDGSGTPLVAWSDGGHAHVARWATDTWREYDSPGAADFVEMTTTPSGAPLLALFGAKAGVRELVRSKWQPLGMDLTVPAPIASQPALAAGDVTALGWVDAGGQLRVYRFDAGWTAIAPLAVGSDSRLALTARGTSLAVAYDQYAASYSVLAAQVTGTATAWTFLGRALDIDISGDAVAPAIVYDTSGAPIVAWTELVETNQRGALARWDGSAWTIVGGITWLDDTQAVPSGTRIALDAGDAAVVATNANGAVHVARFNGPRVAGVGLTSRASIKGCRFDAVNPPEVLSQTGCFDLTTPKHPVPHAGLIPYDVVVDLWSDGAKKRRYIGLPDGARLTADNNGGWVAPVDTIVIKQFDLETTPGDPATRRPIETRFWVNNATLGWSGFSYKWNEAGTDASLLANDTWTFNWQLDDGTQHAHVHPSRGQCRKCHAPPHGPGRTEGGMGPLLGVRPEQLARWYDYGGVIADQLQTLAALGVAPVASATPFISPHQPNETIEHRVRGYMAGNCMHCHNAMHPSIWDMRYTLPFAQMNLCNDITPGNPAISPIYELVTRRPWGMPCIGSLAVDPLAQELFASWIRGMTSCP